MFYIMIGRWMARRVLVLIRGRGRAVHRVLLVGTFTEATDVFAAVTRVPGAGLVPVGIHLTEGYAKSRTADSPVPVFAGRDVLSLVRDLDADTIAVCGSARSTGRTSAGPPGNPKAPASNLSSRPS